MTGERFFSLKTIRGPENQVGLVVRSDLEGRLTEMTGMLTLKKMKSSKGHHYYTADTDVDINGKLLGKPDPIILHVDPEVTVTIARQPSIAMVIAEIDETQARTTVDHIMDIRVYRARPDFIVVAPRDAPLYGGG